MATTKKENEDVVLKYEQEINKIKGVVEDLETKLQVAKVKNPKDSSDISSVPIKKEVPSDKETDIKQFIDKKLIENSNVDHTNKTHKIAYISSICVVGLISALMAYSQK